MRVLIIEDEQPAAHKLIRLLREADKQTEVLDVLGSIGNELAHQSSGSRADLYGYPTGRRDQFRNF